MPYVLVDELSGSNQLEKGHELLPHLELPPSGMT
jgi:hypothetical protein